jgi:hypothetical protein
MAKATPAQTPVSMRALLQRINRRLAHDLEGVKKSRSARAQQELGDYYILDFNRNFIIAGHVDPEALGRDLEVLAPYERVEDDAE